MDNNFKNNLKVKTPTVNKTQSSNFDNNQILSELGLLNLPKELQVSISNDKKYNDGINKLFNDLYTKHYNKITVEELLNDENFKKAKQISDQFSMTKFDDLAKENDRFIRENGLYD